MTDIKEDKSSGEQKTSRLEFINTESPDFEPRSTKYHFTKGDEYDYLAIRVVKEDIAVNMKELVGEYMYAVVYYEKHEDDSVINQLIKDIKDMSTITKLTNYTVRNSPTKTTTITYKNPNHDDQYVTGPEVNWYNSLNWLRDRLGNDIYILISSFCDAVVQCVTEDDHEKLEGIRQSLVD